jgi:hypothetical protein
MNIADAQREEMVMARQKNAEIACSGKAENDACIMQNSRGNMSGTCKTRNDTISCIAQMGGYPPNGAAPPEGDDAQ